MTDRFAIFQLSDDPEYDVIRGASYVDLQRSRIYVDPANYVQMYMSGIREDDTPLGIVQRLRKFPPADCPCDGINTSDVLVIVLNDNEIAYYVDGDRLVLLPRFLKASGDTRLVALDGETYAIEGKAGMYRPVGEMMARTDNNYGIPYFVMQSITDPKQLHILVSVDGKIICENFDRITPQEQARVSKHLETWQKYYENGEYLRTLGDFAGGMVNYSRVDGSRGNQDRDMSEEIRQKQVAESTDRIKKEAERHRAQQAHEDEQHEHQKQEETQHKSLDERLSRAHQVRNDRINGVNEGQTMPGQSQSQPQQQGAAMQDGLTVIMNHLSAFETTINARISSLENRENNHEQLTQTKKATMRVQPKHTVDDLLPEREK